MPFNFNAQIRDLYHSTQNESAHILNSNSKLNSCSKDPVSRPLDPHSLRKSHQSKRNRQTKKCLSHSETLSLYKKNFSSYKRKRRNRKIPKQNNGYWKCRMAMLIFRIVFGHSPFAILHRHYCLDLRFRHRHSSFKAFRNCDWLDRHLHLVSHSPFSINGEYWWLTHLLTIFIENSDHSLFYLSNSRYFSLNCDWIVAILHFVLAILHPQFVAILHFLLAIRHSPSLFRGWQLWFEILH